MLPDIRPSDNRVRDFDFELDQLLLELVLRDHPEWQEGGSDSWFSSWVEVQRLRAERDGAELLSN